MVYAQTRSRPRELDSQNLFDSEIQKDHVIPARRPDQVILIKKMRACKLEDFSRELKKAMENEGHGNTSRSWCTWNDPKWGFRKLEIGVRTQIIRRTTLLRLGRILKRVLETWGDLLSQRIQWKTISKHWCEKLARIYII